MTVSRFLKTIDHLEERVKALEADKESVRGCSAIYRMNYGEKVAEAHIEAQEKLNQLREACGPVVKWLNIVGKHNSDGHTVRCYGDAQAYLTIGDLRKIAELVKGGK